MARKVTSRRVWVSTVAAWLFGFAIFLPILWMFLTSFKSELDAFAMPPKFLLFHWTTENYATVQSRSDYLHHALNSIMIAGGSTLVALVIAVPAAWSMAFSPTKRTKDVLLWMLSTKMMPPVGVLVPIYLIFRDVGLLDTRTGLVLILCLGNLPIVIWMLFTYFKEIPKDILEAARMDGATGFKLFRTVQVPMIRSTLIVVGTTITIATLKVFDIVYTVTGGNFNTDVIATKMYFESFVGLDSGHGGALAVFLFLLVIPAVIFQVRQMRQQREIA